jgi:hypothetical protein
MRSVNSNHLKAGAITIPVKIYKSQKPYGFGASRYHVGCNEKMTQPMVCPAHPDEIADTYSAIEIGGKLVPVPYELRDSLLDKKAPLQVVGSIPLKELPNLLLETSIVENYYVVPEGIDEIRSPNLVAFKSLLGSMKRRNKALLVTAGLGGIKRNCLMLPNGDLLSLSYKEERVDMPSWDADLYPEINGAMNRWIDSLNVRTTYRFSLQTIRQRVDKWLQDNAPAPRTNRKKTAKVTVDA